VFRFRYVSVLIAIFAFSYHVVLLINRIFNLQQSKFVVRIRLTGISVHGPDVTMRIDKVTAV